MESSAPTKSPLVEHTEPIAGTETFWLSAESPAGVSPVLYVHGNPNNADQWSEFLQRTGGVALDLPGFGRSERPHNFDYSIGGYNTFLQAFIGRMGWERFSVVTHDWGGLALVTAQELHERIDRMVIINSVPLLPGYRWHRLARLWRTPLAGEFAMGTTTKSIARFLTKEARPSRERLPPEEIDSMWKYFDHGMQRAILKLYRSAPSDVLAMAGERLHLIQAPALVLWGREDPYIPEEFARAYADALPAGELELLDDAGHWPWIDRPETIDRAAEFLTASSN